ncbi:hypothetical protein [Corynebacterium meridianum]|uniref:Uncharacterized protein n=1 Tax=Corynebacterium meridianum TaxID=2765363 RepID=A0A934M621_9CORY|nr:hypothetical protein [Corynebacterium meridianum]MBI8988159.1 hypothetical protein [Corynebacterium meridianum]
MDTKTSASHNRTEVGILTIICFALIWLFSLADVVLLWSTFQDLVENAGKRELMLPALAILCSAQLLAAVSSGLPARAKFITWTCWAIIGLAIFGARVFANTIALGQEGPTPGEWINAALILGLYVATGIGAAHLGEHALDFERFRYHRNRRKIEALVQTKADPLESAYREQEMIRDWYNKGLENIESEKVRLEKLIKSMDHELKAHARDCIIRELASPKATSGVLADKIVDSTTQVPATDGPEDPKR